MRAPYNGQSLEEALNDEQVRKAPPSQGPSDSPPDPPFIVDGREIRTADDLVEDDPDNVTI